MTLRHETNRKEELYEYRTKNLFNSAGETTAANEVIAASGKEIA